VTAGVLQRGWAAALALFCVAACDGSRLPDAAAERAARATTASGGEGAEQRAPASDAADTELERAVRTTEAASGLPQAPLLSQEELLLVLEYHCGECHFPAAYTDNTNGLFYMNDVEQLIASAKVIPGDGAGSRLVRRMRSGEMPPPQSTRPPVPADTVLRIAQYIDSLMPTVPAAPSAPPPPPPWIGETRPDVAPVDAACFAYLGDWIRCEHEGNAPARIELPGSDLEHCLQACREHAECVAVTDYTWLELPDLGCYLYLSSCDAPATGAWHEEDGGRQYLKTCASE
jgi:hypothetical protein